MSCHFHLLRRRKAAEVLRKTAEAARNVEVAENKANINPEPEAVQKAAKSRKKGDV